MQIISRELTKTVNPPLGRFASLCITIYWRTITAKVSVNNTASLVPINNNMNNEHYLENTKEKPVKEDFVNESNRYCAKN